MVRSLRDGAFSESALHFRARTLDRAHRAGAVAVPSSRHAGALERAWLERRPAGERDCGLDARTLALSTTLHRRPTRHSDAGSWGSDAGARLCSDRCTARHRRPAHHQRLRAGWPHGPDELSDAVDHLRHAVLRIRARTLVANRRGEGGGNRRRDLHRPDSAERVVAHPLSVRTTRMDLAPTHLRATDLRPPLLSIRPLPRRR